VLVTGLAIKAEAVMNKTVLVIIALATTAVLGSRSAQAYYDGPWCGVYSIAPGGAVEKCDYRDFESCRMDTIAGNRGFCRQNGYYQGNAAAYAPRHRKARRHAER
jgi:hypothetical protein